MTAGAGSCLAPTAVEPTSPTLNPIQQMLSDFEPGAPMPYRQPPAPYHMGVPPGLPPPMPGYPPPFDPYHQGPPPPFVQLPVGLQQVPAQPGMLYVSQMPPGLPPHPSWAERFGQQPGQPGAQQQLQQPPGLQQQQQQQPPGLQPHPSWTERFPQHAEHQDRDQQAAGHGQLQQQQQRQPQGLLHPPGLQQQQQRQPPGLQRTGADAAGQQQQQQADDPGQEQQQAEDGRPGSAGGMRIRFKVPRGMQLPNAGGPAQQQQQQHRQDALGAPGRPWRRAVLLSDEAEDALVAPGRPAAARRRAVLLSDNDEDEDDAVLTQLFTRDFRDVAANKEQAQGAAEAGGAAAAAGGGYRGASGQRAAAGAAAAGGGHDRPPGIQAVRFTRQVTEVTQVDVILGGQQQQQEQQPGAHRAARPPAVATAADLRRLSYPDYFQRVAADTSPFWAPAPGTLADGVLAVAHLLQPQGSMPGAMSDAQCQLSFLMEPQQLQQLQYGVAILQLSCFKLGDSVPYRVHWPFVKQQVQVNGSLVIFNQNHMAKRLKQGSAELQPHQGDLPVDVTKQALAAASQPASRLSRQMRVSVYMKAQVTVPKQGTEVAHPLGGYVLGARLVRTRNIEEVKRMLWQPPSLQQAVRELQEKLAGDDDVVAAATTVATRCAASMVPMQTPANFGTGEGLVCFDLDNFLEMSQKSGKVQCPGTRNFHTWRQLQRSPWMAAVLESLEEAGLKDSVTHVEVAPDAKWRPQGASCSCWFDVLSPPTSQQLRASLQQGAAADGAGDGDAAGVFDDTDDADEGAGRAAKRQRREPQKEVITIDTDSDDDQPALAAAAAGAGREQAAAPGLRFKLAAQGGRGGAAGGSAQQQQQQQQAAHRHAQQHQVSRHEWRHQAEVVARAQAQQQLRLVRQRSGVDRVGPYTAMMMMEGAADSQQQQPGVGAGDGWPADSGDEPYDPLADFDEAASKPWTTGTGAAAGAAGGGGAEGCYAHRGADRQQRAAAVPTMQEFDAFMAAIAAGFVDRDEEGSAPVGNAPDELRDLHDTWRGGRQPAQRRVQQQQQQRRPTAPARRQQQRHPPAQPDAGAPVHKEIEVIELLSDSE